MDKSLDDIISSNRGKYSLRRGGKRGGSGGAKGTGGGARGGFRRVGGRGGGFTSPRGGVQKRGRPAAYNRGPMPDVWSHDKFAESGAATRSFGGGAANSRAGTGKLMISNLDFGVNDSDINELFAEFGPMKKAAVHYDKSGRSLGTAEVWYERHNDAVKAMKQYNGVPLDGRPMNISIVGGSGAGATQVSASHRLGSPRGGYAGKPQRGRGGAARGRGGARGRGAGRGGRGGRSKGPAPSADALDAELDAYRNKMDTA